MPFKIENVTICYIYKANNLQLFSYEPLYFIYYQNYTRSIVIVFIPALLLVYFNSKIYKVYRSNKRRVERMTKMDHTQVSQKCLIMSKTNLYLALFYLTDERKAILKLETWWEIFYFINYPKQANLFFLS